MASLRSSCSRVAASRSRELSRASYARLRRAFRIGTESPGPLVHLSLALTGLLFALGQMDLPFVGRPLAVVGDGFRFVGVPLAVVSSATVSRLSAVCSRSSA